VIVKTAWSGSVGGVFSLTSGNGLPDATASPAITAGFLVDPTPTSPPPGTANVPAKFEIPVGSAALDKPGFPNIAMSDSFQASSSFKTPVLADTQVGVIPFVWVRNNGSPATITNMSNQLAAAILLNGSLPQSHFDNSGSTTPVFVTGRNSDSGTRLDAFAESYFGIDGAPVQLDPTNPPPGNFDHVAAGAWVGGPGGIAYFGPADGFSSGGPLSIVMQATGSLRVIGGYLVTYLALNDAASAVAGGAALLTYNGFAYSATAVEIGQYSFWSYEHFLKGPTFDGVPDSDPHVVAANALAAQIATDAATSGISLSSMHASRASEGTPVF
jgi:hypothetical protein